MEYKLENSRQVVWGRSGASMIYIAKGLAAVNAIPGSPQLAWRKMIKAWRQYFKKECLGLVAFRMWHKKALHLFTTPWHTGKDHSVSGARIKAVRSEMVPGSDMVTN